MDFENGRKSRIVGYMEGERKAATIILTEPTEEQIDERKKALFGDFLPSISPEIADGIAGMLRDDQDLLIDDEIKEILVFASETIPDPVIGLRDAMEGIAHHISQDVYEISTSGPGGEFFKKLENRAFKQLDKQPSGPTEIDIIDILKTEQAAALPSLGEPATLSLRELQPGVVQTIVPLRISK